ncbi:TMEM143 family protein [Allorhizocola rhizosphaerae]|uniref:TMEM143 family protein n=1 Tax=Allorhizocola rhizosphaerae TaxID=1872709 RepID=UPI000E3DD086|nr:TMEM143 family protein [Allorhizocola rhizosphaerae]
MSGEHFIPFRKADIVAMLADEVDEAEREPFRGFARMLAVVLHLRFHERIEALKDAYHPFNSDSDTRTVAKLGPQEREAARGRLEAELTELARAANFTEIDPAELDRAFTEHSLLKVRLAVDRSAIDRILLFRRGEATVTREVPVLFGLRRKSVTVTEYSRVLVYARFRDGRTIIKLFQNVPREDLEMVFPHVQVRMRGIDKWLIGVPAIVSGIVMIATKLVTSVGLLLLLIAFWMGLHDDPVTLDRTGLVTVGIGLTALGAYFVRQVTNFKNRKILFMKALSENLYFRNLDNDAGVFHHLLDAAEEAEVIEALLAYHFIRTAPKPLTTDDLDLAIEDWFAQRWAERVDFEVDDGLRKLREFGLVREDGAGLLTAAPLNEAARLVRPSDLSAPR